MQKNDEIIIDITDITSDGSGVGRYEGMAVFVPLTAVGDTVRVHILKVKKNYAFAKLTEIITPSPDRTENDCDVFRKCGGCVYRHLSYKAELEIKQNTVYETMKRIGGYDIPPKAIIPSVRSERYRNKAQYPISVNGGTGFYAFHSHRIVPLVCCPLQPLIFDKISAVFTDWVNTHGISIYNEERHSGLIRHLYIRIAEATGEIMVCTVINGDSLPYADMLISALAGVCGDNLKSVQININREKTNVILGDKCKTLYGKPYITDVLCGVKIRISPLSFYQVNRATAELLYKKAAKYAKPCGADILDLYCGAGTIGLSMANSAKSIIGVEIVPQAVEDAKYNAEINGITNAEFICADASAAAKELAKRNIKPKTVIIDPPRKGCTAELIKTVAESFSPERVVYVSCDPATLARDVKMFKENGYILSEYTPVDMFPRTAHTECVALILRS